MIEDDETYDPMDRLDIEFRAIKDQYDEIFNDRALNEYTQEELADFMDDWVQITDSQIGVMRIIWENLKIFKRLIDSKDMFKELIEASKQTDKTEGICKGNKGMFA